MPPPSQNYSQRRTGYNSRYDEDGYRHDGRKKIQGYSQSQGPVRTYGGLNEYYALQDRNNRAFADPRFPGKSAGEISQNAQAMGQQINRSGQAEDAYSNRFRRSTSREENVAAAKRSGEFAKLRKEYNKANPGKRMNKAGDIVDRKAAPVAAAPSVDDTPAAYSARSRATGMLAKASNDTPAAASAAARASGPLAKVGRMVEGKLPNEDHSSPLADVVLDEVVVEAPATPKFKYDPVAPRQMYKDAASQRSIIARGDGSAEITSAYGSGSSTPRASTPEATVKDDFGNIVPMKDYLARRKYVQSTQEGYKPSRRTA